MKYYSIGEASATYDIPESTLRYYEKKGLLPFIERDEAGRRLFSERQLALLQIVICLKNTNMPISGIRQYMEWVVEGDTSIQNRLDMLVKHKQKVADEIALMNEHLLGIDDKIERYQKQLRGGKTMKLTGNTILITGGGSGIGLAMAERFVQSGNTVIVCGRRENVLEQAREQVPGLITRVCDLEAENERLALFDWVTANYPDVNVLVNNAGIQLRYNLLKADARDRWQDYSKEIATNIEAPVHLSMLFAPYFAAKETAAILNVTSGLAFTPFAIAPVYSATKAALHSFTVSLRHQLSDTSVEVIEIAPPAVNTDLGGSGLHTHGEPLDAFTEGIFKGLAEGKQEIGYGSSAARLRMSRDEIDEYTEKMYQATKNFIES
ncbi:hypothetical protein HMSSN139_21160 [Paenibacillus sp. HMSSN-139]|jgi:uncharacterized oxidoreductase|nr:hypothetical protein HMSSN139_21160 [Paenibacillus sp. HMSSN-139]